MSRPTTEQKPVITDASSETAAESMDLLDEVELLRAENGELRKMLEKIEQLLTETTRSAEFWAEQQKEQERMLEDKSQVIRELHLKIQELQQNREPTEPRSQAGSGGPQVDELLALSEELEREKRQLKEDEDALMQQMREMEVQMSRERAELARQRGELQRLHGEIKHELELASRETELRNRLQPLQRKHQDLTHRKGSEPSREAPPAPPEPPAAEPPKEQQPGKTSGMFRRFFGQ